MTAKSTMLAFAFALLASALPLQADRAAADEIALKCSFSLWDDRIEVGYGSGADTPMQSPKAMEARLARAPSQKFEIAYGIDLDRRLYEKPDGETYEITQISIKIYNDKKWDYNRVKVLFPSRGFSAGYHYLDALIISRIDLGVEAHFRVFFGRDDRPADIHNSVWDISARVKVKGSCTRVPKML